jgi:hypothetical protein
MGIVALVSVPTWGIFEKLQNWKSVNTWRACITFRNFLPVFLSVLPLRSLPRCCLMVLWAVVRVGERVPSHTLSRVCAWKTLGNFVYILFSIFLYFSNCRFENQAVYANYITLYNNSRQTNSTTIALARKYVLTSRLLDNQDWAAGVPV